MTWEQWGSLGLILLAFAALAFAGWSNDGYCDHLMQRHAEREKREHRRNDPRPELGAGVAKMGSWASISHDAERDNAPHVQPYANADDATPHPDAALDVAVCWTDEVARTRLYVWEPGVTIEPYNATVYLDLPMVRSLIRDLQTAEARLVAWERKWGGQGT